MVTLAPYILHAPPRNILSIDLIEQMRRDLAELAASGPDAIVWSSGLEWGFSAGVDLNDHTPERVPAMLDAVHGLFRDFVDLPCLLVAQVHGPCLGGAAELALACDLVYCTEDSTFGFPEIRVGCYPPIALATLADRLGHARALPLLLSGDSISARRAEELGLVTAVLARQAVEGQLNLLLQGSSRATRTHLLLTERRVRRARWETALEIAEEAYADLPPADLAEGLAAFFERRPPLWKNA